MELLVAMGVGVMVAAGIYLLLRERTFSVVVGLALVSYAVNLFVFASGRLRQGVPPIVVGAVGEDADPLAQALVLTAIVIGFAMTAFIVTLSIVSHLRIGDDRSDAGEEEP
jgi:multicomponent K+:H+ antiporter subunit C